MSYNINLKNVKITDTLPANASVVSSSEAYTVDGDDIIWSFNDVTAPDGLSIDLTLAYDIDRDGDEIDEGVDDGRKRTNEVRVTGQPITTTIGGVEIASDADFTFTQDYDSVTTSFVRSTAIWNIGLLHDENNRDAYTYAIPLNVNITTAAVDYDIYLSDGDIALKNGEIVYYLPDDVIGVQGDSDTIYFDDIKTIDLEGNYSDLTDGVINLVDRIITWSDKTFDVLDDIDSDKYIWTIKLIYAIDRDGAGVETGVEDGFVAENTVAISGVSIDADGNAGADYSFGVSEAAVETTFEDMDIYWNAVKSGMGTYYLPFTDVDEESDTITYTLKLQTEGDSTDESNNIQINTVTFVDDLPDYAEYISYDSNATVSAITSSDLGAELTFNLSDIPENEEPYVEVKVKYHIDGAGDGTGVVEDTSQINCFTVSDAKDVDGNAVHFNIADDDEDIAQKTTTFKASTEPNPIVTIEIDNYTKNSSFDSDTVYNQLNSSTFPGNRNYESEDEITYIVTFNNKDTANEDTPLTNAAITIDVSQAAIDVSSIELGSSSTYDISYNVTVYTSEGTRDILNQSTATNATYTTTDLGMIEGECIEYIVITYTEEVPNKFNYNENSIKINGTVRSSASTETNFQNSVNLEYEYMEFGGNYVAGAATNNTYDEVWFRVIHNIAWISNLGKEDITGRASYSTNKTVSFEITLGTNSLLGTDGLEEAKIIDVVPAAFDISTLVWDNETTWSTDNSDVSAPTMKVYEEVLDSGESIIVWSFGEEIPEGSGVTINYTLDFQPYAGIGTHTNELYLTAGNAYLWGTGLSQEEDAANENYDYDEDTTERLIGDPESVLVIETAAVTSTLWIKGARDTDYSKYPEVGRTIPGGLMEYEIEIFNDGNVPLEEVTIVDILPYKGDTGVLDTDSRGSLWTPYLIEAIEDGRQQIVVDQLGTESTVNLEIAYSTASDPIRSNVTNDGTIGTEEPNWSTIPPDDLTSVRSLMITMSAFEDLSGGSKSLEAGEVGTIDITMRAPVGAPYASNPDETNPDLQEAAWNSIGMTGIRNTETLQWNEPLKVGIIIDSNPIGEIGNFVWFDTNEDGVQNDGYDDEYAGLNGITAILYNSRGEEVDRTLTGNSHDGLPGYYLFPYLEKDTYYVEFVIPEEYQITTYENGDAELDSDGYLSGSAIRTELISIDTDSSDEDDYLIYSVDLGVIPNETEPEAIITKSAIGYITEDNNTVMFDGDEEPVNIGETVLYEVTITNTGDLPLNNVTVKDTMDNAGFTFTNADYTDADSNTT